MCNKKHRLKTITNTEKLTKNSEVQYIVINKMRFCTVQKLFNNQIYSEYSRVAYIEFVFDVFEQL